jgi:AAA domain (dynein-related subfamily)
MRLESGNVLAAKMNAHRHQWNGTICSQPQSWNCGADAAFRANFCDANVPRCFHVDVFKPNSPRFLTPDSSVVMAVQQQPKIFDDQVMAFYGGRFGVQQGIAPGDYEQTLLGFYRIKHAILDTTRTPLRLIIEPHADAWAIFPRMHLRPATLRSVSGVAYLKQMRSKGLKDAVAEALEAAPSLPKSDGWSSELQRRLQRAGEMLPSWLQQAEGALAKLPTLGEAPRISASFGNIEGTLAAKLKGIKISTVPAMPKASAVKAEGPAMPATLAQTPVPVVQVTPISEPIEVPTALVKSDDDPATDRVEAMTQGSPTVEADPKIVSVANAPLMDEPLIEDPEEVQAKTLESEAIVDAPPVHMVPEPHGRQILESQFGSQLVDALSVAFITKSLVILTGAPGAGKSWIASRLLDDTDRDRTVIVPVASTWRGREDLLGYVNPINGSFEATEFTLFLCDAQDAWEAGDKRARLVVFEEFNLSQPEHWLSDLLVRLEYDANQLSDRTVRLGGKEIVGRSGRACSVVLAPSLRFAATLNNDHTVKPLSPRVLDRAALIEVTSSGRAALSRAGVELGDDLEDVIDELNDLLEPRGAAFSVRSARSLQRAMEAGSTNGMGLSRALDLVLVQEVLSRVRLMAGDPRDEQLLSRLQVWTQKPGCAELVGCAARIADWAEFLSAGRDVFQA